MAFLIASGALLVLTVLAAILIKASFRSDMDDSDKPLSMIRIVEVVATLVAIGAIFYLVDISWLKYSLSSSLAVGMLLTRSVTANALKNFLAIDTKEVERLNDPSTLDVVKKYERAVISKKKGIYFFTGLTISLVFTALVIEYTTETIYRKEIVEEVVYVEEEIFDVPITEVPPPPPPKPKVTPQFEEVPDEVLIEEPEIDIEPEEEEVEEEYFEETEEEEEVIEEDNSIFDLFSLQQQPVYPGGMGALQAYAMRSYKVAARDAEEGNFGKIYVQFVIEKDGTVGEVKVLRGINDRMNNEAIRVIKSLPKWTPGKNAGAPVRVRYMFPFNIKGS
ncbi:MAG: TonB family protein [Cytophagales bacterium]|nr:TonB family protein [Cytophagales bacterium]